MPEGENGKTYSFPADGREEFTGTMQNAGYVELLQVAYRCDTCEYMVRKQDSPTGYWCNKFKFPDRPFGCCDGWEAK